LLAFLQALAGQVPGMTALASKRESLESIQVEAVKHVPSADIYLRVK